ncbi:MAG: hypothetical protein ACHQVS_03315, partial [Candidatus Babeliales bacterium]
FITIPFHAAEKTKRKNTPRKIAPVSQKKKFKPTPTTPPLTPTSAPSHTLDEIFTPTLISQMAQSNQEQILRLLTQALFAQQQQASLRITKLEEQMLQEREKHKKHTEELESRITILAQQFDGQATTLQDHTHALTALTTACTEHRETIDYTSDQLVDFAVATASNIAALSRGLTQEQALRGTDPIMTLSFDEQE